MNALLEIPLVGGPDCGDVCRVKSESELPQHRRGSNSLDGKRQSRYVLAKSPYSGRTVYQFDGYHSWKPPWLE